MLQVTALNKSFGPKKVVVDFNLTLRKGEFYSLLGPNGAGKSTTINCIAQLIAPDSGTIVIGDADTAKKPVKAKKLVGLVPQEIALYEDLSAWDNLVFWGKLNRVGKTLVQERAKALLERFGLFERRHDRVSTYSGGMKRRINIAAALLHDPELILLDEPTVGIDPQSRNNIYEFLEELRKRGKTILYTTHYMEEAERFSDRIGIIDHGTILDSGTFAEIKKNVSIADQIVVAFEGDPNGYAEKFAGLGHDVQIEGYELRMPTNDFKTDLKNLVVLFNESPLEIVHIEKKEVDLETIFLKLTGKHLRD
jgi:ABC-2 type transport system ATP-binding protein